MFGKNRSARTLAAILNTHKIIRFCQQPDAFVLTNSFSRTEIILRATAKKTFLPKRSLHD